MSLFRSNLSPKARSVIVQYALFRWENAVVVGGTVLLTVFSPALFPGLVWLQSVWPLLGLLGVGGIFVSSVTNERANAQLLLKLTQAQYNLRQIQMPELRQKVESALEYQRRIEGQVRPQRALTRVDSPLWDRPEDTADQLNDWIANVYNLAVRLDAYRRDQLLAQELKNLPPEIEQLRAKRQREKESLFQQELDALIDSKQKHLQTLQALDMRMRQAEFQLQQSLAALATVDSQVKLLDAQDVESGHSERLRADIKEQVNRLNDLVMSLNEVYEAKGTEAG